MVGIRGRGARDKRGADRDGLLGRVDRIIHRAPGVGLALEPQRRRGRGLLFGQAIDLVVHDHQRHLDVLAGRVREMIAADGEGIAVAAEGEDVQIRAGERNAAGKGQRAAMQEVRAVRLHEIREPAGTADAGNGGDLLMPQLALFNQLEIQRQHREIAAAGTPSRMVGDDFFSGQRPCVRRWRAGGRVEGRPRDFQSKSGS